MNYFPNQIPSIEEFEVYNEIIDLPNVSIVNCSSFIIDSKTNEIREAKFNLKVTMVENGIKHELEHPENLKETEKIYSVKIYRFYNKEDLFDTIKSFNKVVIYFLYKQGNFWYVRMINL